MSHEVNLPFEMFQRYSLALSIIAKQKELIELMKHRNNKAQIELLENGIKLMIQKLREESPESDGIEDFIINTGVRTATAT